MNVIKNETIWTVQLQFARKASTFMKYGLAKVRHVGPLSRWHLQSAFSVAFEMHMLRWYIRILRLFTCHCLYDEKCCDAHDAFSDIHAIVLQEKDQKCLSPIWICYNLSENKIYIFFLFMIIIINNLHIL